MSHFLKATILATVALMASHCAARQVRNEMELQEAAKLAAENQEKGWLSLERTVRTKDEDPDVEMQRKALAEVGKIPSPRSQALLSENVNNRYLRAEAIGGLMKQRDDNNRAAIDAMIVEAAARNAQEFSGLTREEIQALGESDNPEAVRLLKQQMGRDPNKDEMTIDALGKILKRQKRSSYSPLDFTLPLGQAATAPKVSIEDISTTRPPGETTTDSPGTEEKNAADTDPESVLLQYLAGDGNPETKDRAVQNIDDSRQNGIAYLLSLAGKSSSGVKARIAIIDFLTRHAVNTQDKSMIGKFQVLRRRAGSNRELAQSIDLSLRVLGSAFGRTVAVGTTGRRRIVVTDGFDPLPREADIVKLDQRPYPGYSSADVRTNLKKALTYYKLDARIADRMQKRVSDLLNLPQNKESPERNLIFTALGRLYPERDFYVLKKQGQDAFAKPGYFTTTLRLVTSSARGRSWQIAALQRVWGLTENEADRIRQIYLRDGKLLQQRMRL